MTRHSTKALSQDESLGTVCWHDGCWTAIVATALGGIEVSIFSDSAAIPDWARNLVVQGCRNIGDFVSKANDYLTRDLSAKELAMGPYTFSPTGISTGAAWQQSQNSFTLYLELDGDPDGLWRVEFGPTGPIDSGRDS